MPKLYRPYIPLKVRVQVAHRQVMAIALPPERRYKGSIRQWEPDSEYLALLLRCLFADRKCELHHRPALINRESYVRVLKGKQKTFYRPPANDPAHLVYLPTDEHDIETRVRGLGAQRSDLGQRRYNKRVEENRGKRQRPKAKIGSRGFTSDSGTKVRTAKRKWPKRSFR